MSASKVVNTSDGWREWKARYQIKPFTETVDEITRQALLELCPEKKVVLYFSTGKDSVAAWLTLREMGFEVVPVFRELIPNLSFYESVIAAYEKFFDTEIIKIPSAVQMSQLYANFGNQEEQNSITTIRLIENIKKLKTHKNNDDRILNTLGYNIGVVGTKGSDNLSRRVNFQMAGPFNAKNRCFSLCWRLASKAPLRMMVEAKCPIPKYYLWLGRSPELLFSAEFFFIKKYYPEDYEKILQYLPDIDVRVKDFECNPKPRILPVSKLMQEQYALTQERFV